MAGGGGVTDRACFLKGDADGTCQPPAPSVCPGGAGGQSCPWAPSVQQDPAVPADDGISHLGWQTI